MAPHLIFYLLKVLSILSAKIRSERAFPQGAMMLFLVTKKSLISVCMHGDDVIRNFCIDNEGDSEQGGGRPAESRLKNENPSKI